MRGNNRRQFQVKRYIQGDKSRNIVLYPLRNIAFDIARLTF